MPDAHPWALPRKSPDSRPRWPLSWTRDQAGSILSPRSKGGAFDGFYIVAGVLLATQPGAAQAESWKLFSSSPEGALHYYDPASLVRSGNSVEVEVRIDNSRDSRAAAASEDWTHSVDCSNRTYTPLTYPRRQADGRIIDFRNMRFDGNKPRQVSTGSIAEDLFDAVCRR